MNYKIKDMINTNIKNSLEIENILQKKLTNAKIELKNRQFHLVVNYNDDNILLVKTLIT